MTKSFPFWIVCDNQMNYGQTNDIQRRSILPGQLERDDCQKEAKVQERQFLRNLLNISAAHCGTILLKYWNIFLFWSWIQNFPAELNLVWIKHAKIHRPILRYPFSACILHPKLYVFNKLKHSKNFHSTFRNSSSSLSACIISETASSPWDWVQLFRRCLKLILTGICFHFHADADVFYVGAACGTESLHCWWCWFLKLKIKFSWHFKQGWRWCWGNLGDVRNSTI